MSTSKTWIAAVAGALVGAGGAFAALEWSGDDSRPDTNGAADDRAHGDGAEADEQRTHGAGSPGRPEYYDMVGRFRPAPTIEESDDAAPEDVDDLGDLGYAAGYERSPDASGVVFYAPDLAQDGLNLAHDGSAPSAILMDMEGEELHRWTFPLEDALTPEQYAETTKPMGPFQDKTGYWRRVHLYPNGDLLAIFSDAALLKLDRDSNLLWKWYGGAHHDVDVDEETGHIYVLSRKIHIVPRYSPEKNSAEDFVTVLDDDGTPLRHVSILRAFETSDFESQRYLCHKGGDLQHANTLELLDGSLADRIPAFAKGNVLTSLRKTSTIAVIDLETEKVVWSLAGAFHKQHQPTVLENDNLLLFDNLGWNGSSKVIEFDPSTQEIVWSYRDSPETPFSSRTCGSNQRLANGNTLIVETDSGRAFEVAPNGSIVWEYLTPNRAGEDGRLIASLFDLIRIDASEAAWLVE